MSLSLTSADFKPGKWEIINNGYSVVDRTTGRKFENAPLDLIRDQACMSLFYSTCWGSLMTALTMTGRAVKIISCYHFWKDNDPESNGNYIQLGAQNIPLTLKQRLKDAGIEGSKFVGGPFFFVAHQCLICINVIQPSRNHVKYVNAFERLQYDDRCFVVCCFRPFADLEPPKQERMEESPPNAQEIVMASADPAKPTPLAEEPVSENAPPVEVSNPQQQSKGWGTTSCVVS